MSKLGGVFCAAATPLSEDLTPDHVALAAHCGQLLEDGCHGIALLGSTGEANSFSISERKDMLAAVVDAGIAPTRLMPGTGLCAGPDTVDLTRHALSLGVTTVVMLPPFYYKGVSDNGLLDTYVRTIDTIADDRLRVVLYHIPPISQIPLSLDLVARLIDRFPATIAGVKDSGGDLANMTALSALSPDLAVFAGADPLLLPHLKAGGAGCITATSNLAGSHLRTVFDHWQDPSQARNIADAQAQIVALREVSNSFPQIPTIKAMVGHRYGEPGWARTRPPLQSLSEDQLTKLATLLDGVDAEHPA